MAAVVLRVSDRLDKARRDHIGATRALRTDTDCSSSMIGFFRSFFQSKIGIFVTLAFLGLIAFAFASSDVANTNAVGGLAGGDQVAVVGDTKISASELDQAARNALRQAQQQNPTLTMEAFVADGGLEQVLEGLIERAAIAEFARENGFRAGDRLIDSEIVNIPAFRGPDGRFDQNMFRSALAQQRIQESDLRRDLGVQLLSSQVSVPANFGGYMPEKLARRYAALFKERRSGELGLLPSAAFAPKADPTAQQLTGFYTENRANYVRPERRVIRYATFGADAVKNLRAPTDAEIQARYNENKAQYAASEERSFTQLVVPTEGAARAILDQVAQGTTLDAAARAQGLQTSEVELLSRNELASAASSAVASAAFSAREGTLASPARGSLGWYVLRVDNVERTPARSLAQVRGEISEAIAAEQKREALAQLTESIEERFASGETLTEVAKSLGAQVQSTKPLLADGRVFGSADEMAPEVLQRALPPAFAMDENQPELGQLQPGQQFLLFDVSEITPAEAAPLGEIRDQVVAEWKRSRGLEDARKAADRVMKRVRDGATLSEAMTAEKVSLPPTESLRFSREQLAQMGDRVPPPVVLFFSMAADTVKRLEAPQEQGWFLVSLDTIEPGELAQNDPLIAGAQQQLGTAVSNESVDLLRKAILAEVGVERNEQAIAAAKARLLGGN